MTRARWAAAALTAVALAFPTKAAAVTWQDVRAICSESETACRSYILGVIDAVLYANQDHVCFPAKPQAAAVESITATAEMIPHLWPTLDAYELVYAWLAARYPCNAVTAKPI